jgi:DNA-binding CsgD family transcriptional regulator
MCGFDRAILFRAEGPELVAESVGFEGDPDWGGAVLEFADRARPPLNQATVESDASRRRRPVLVRDAQRDAHTYRPLVVATDTQSYVAAPIAPNGEVIGFLHADRYFTGQVVDELDRDVLSAFAEGFGCAAARTTLLDRMRSEHRRVRQMLAAAEAAMDRICDSRIALERVTAEPEQPARRRDAATASLTPRQRQIIELMADGATNADIANRLVLSQDTVKFHVRHILKRMQAANRAEAVSRYLRLEKPGA